MAADVVGYSRMMGLDEEGTLDRVKALRREVMDPCIARKKGRLVKTTGDGFLIEFASVFDAFHCARAVQCHLRDRPAPGDEAIALRIAINVGDIIFDDGDVFGDGVNVAARLEPLAPIGGICVSRRAWEDLRRLGLPFEDIGEQRLKNIRDPVRVFQIQADQLSDDPVEAEAPKQPRGFGFPWRHKTATTAPSSAGRSGRRTSFSRGFGAIVVAILLIVAVAGVVARHLLAAKDAGPTTIAVLPFKNLDKGDEALVYGIWEDTREALSRNPNLRVIGRQSAQTLAQQNLQPAAYQSKLGIDYLLDGTMRRSGKQIRFSVSLVRTDDGVEIWTDTLDRSLDDAFKLQSEVASEIEGRIRGRLASKQGTQPDNIATSAPVYMLFNDARAQLREHRGKGSDEALQQLKQAVAIDPNYAPAWAALSVAQRLNPTTSAKVSRGEYDAGKFVKAEAYARRAITLAPNLASGHAALGLALGNKGPVAEAELRTAVRLDPNDVNSLIWLANVVGEKGQVDEAREFFDRALAIEPLWWPVVLERLYFLLSTGGDQQVDSELGRVERAGDQDLASLMRMYILEWRGDFSEAIKIGLQSYHRPQHGASDFSDIAEGELWTLLLDLGFSDEVDKIGKPPPFAPFIRRNDPRGLDMVEALKLPPEAFWQLFPLSEAAGRAYVLTGRGPELAALYRTGAGSPDGLAKQVGGDLRFVQLAPLVSLALRQADDPAEADRLISAADGVLQNHVGMIGPGQREAFHARILAVQGRFAEAADAILDAVKHGWFPNSPVFNIDLENDSPLALLKQQPRFQEARRLILDHARRERAELGNVTI